MAGLTVVGHIAIDRVIDARGERVQLGGTPTYVATVTRRLGASIEAVTKVGKDIPKDFVSSLHEVGLDLEGMIVEEAETTRFVLDYRWADRVLSVSSVCDVIGPEDISERPEAVLIAPIVEEIPQSTVSCIQSDTIALDPQGFLREILEDGRIIPKHWSDERLLKRLTIFKSSEEELKLITGEANPLWGLEKLIRIGVDVAIATRGREGALLVTRRNRFSIPVLRLREELDPTGAGDAFMGGFISEYLHGEDLLWCASMGSATASCIVETLGAKIDSSIKEVRKRADEIYNNTKKL